MHTRTAHPSDKPVIIALWQRCGLVRAWNDPDQDFDFAHQGAASCVLVLDVEGDIIGACLVGHDGHRGAVYYLGIDPDCRKQGAGRALMAGAEAWLRDRGVWKLNLLVRQENAEVIQFYERLGYGDQACVALGKRLDGHPDRQEVS